MIFPTESVLEAREQLHLQVVSGKLTPEEGFRERLQIDPEDAEALSFFAANALQAGRPDEAGAQARELIRVHPKGYEGYVIAAQSLGEADDSLSLRSGYLQLAYEKLRDSPDGADRPDMAELARIAPLIPERNTVEAAEVANELEPYRLMAKLYDSWDDLLDRSVVDDILRNADVCAPLLRGVLKEWGEGLLAEEDQLVVERALVLLGEIGDPAILPDLTEFLIRPDDDLSGPADWAFGRIAWQHPEQTLDKIRTMVTGASGIERNALALQIAVMKNIPGRSEVLVSLLEGIDHMPSAEQEAVAAGVIAGVLMAEGSNSPLAASLEKQHAELLSKALRRDLRDLRKDVADGPAPDLPSEYDVYQICCEEPKPEAPDTPKPGRNDPCWCGSNKKYKKCHLAEDERR
ncbi:MAG TPA: SEC-C domain-containing protein [Bryobacteraceae bacterium]|jgi:hypothetical protein